MEPRARLRSPCDTSIGTSCAAGSAVETSRSIDVGADAPGDAFSALPLRPCNAAALANSGVPMLVSQGRCDGFTWLSTTSAGQRFYSAILEHGPKHGFGSVSICRWLLFGTGAAPGCLIWALTLGLHAERPARAIRRTWQTTRAVCARNAFT